MSALLNLSFYVKIRRAATVISYSGARFVHYVQGQSPKRNTREYFYFIDHHGQLFLDDARMKNFTSCFKEKKFLQFFFSRLKFNTTDRYPEFPYLSPCGREKNYIRCDDLPIVFTEVIPTSSQDKDLFSYGYTGELMTVDFQPEKVCMLPESGRIYHPGPESLGGVGLIKSSLAIEFSKLFTFEEGKDHEPPTRFHWKGHDYQLNNELYDKIRTLSEQTKLETAIT